MERTRELVRVKSFTFMENIQLLVEEASLATAPADGILVLAQPFPYRVRVSW